MLDYTKPSIEEALAHSGVKGMKWGVVKEDIRHPRQGAKKITEARKSHRTDVIKKNEANIKMLNTKISTLTKANEELKGNRNASAFATRRNNTYSINMHKAQRDKLVKDTEAKKKS